MSERAAGGGGRAADGRGRAAAGKGRAAAGAVAGAAGLVATGYLARSPEVPAAERRVYEAIGRVPRSAGPAVWAVMQAGSLPAVYVAAGLALAARRPRLASAVAISGTTTWVAAKLVKRVVKRGRPASLLEDVAIYGRPQSGLGFPSGHAAVAAAMMTAAAPHLSPRARAAGWTAVGVVAAARMFVGAHLPLDVAGGLALGFAMGNVVKLADGAVPALGAAAEDARSWSEEAAARTPPR